MVIRFSNPTTEETAAGELQVQSQTELYNEFQVILDRVRSFFKNI